ncbi:GntR family transcriptional regulator [Actinopolymorpha rutila]|uniref:GntR family transcriptional regulator n=1 Tax=Actinopolymorpha rutila TaxID=446787 RepID=UPI0015C93BF3
MSPKIERTRPPYLQIADDLRRQIENGALREGDTVPSVRQLAADWGVAHGTARTALAVLRTEGLVVGVPGTGTIVQKRGDQGAGARAREARGTGRIYPPGQYAKITAAELVPAPDEVAVGLGVDAGSEVIRRARVTYRTESDGSEIPQSASTSWFAGELAEQAPLLLERDRIVQGTFGYIEEMTGRTPVEVLEELRLSEAGSDEEFIFGVEPGAPIIRGENWLLDDEGDVIEYGQSVLRPDRTVSYRFRLDQGSGAEISTRPEPRPDPAARWHRR